MSAGQAAVVLAFAAAAALVVLHMAAFLALHRNALPIYDEWALWTTMRRVAAGEDTPLHALFSAHNEHRILLTRLAFLIDLAAGGRDAVLRALTIVTQAATTGMLLWLAASGRRTNWIGLCAGATIVAMMATLRQGENFTSGFQLQFVLAIAMPCMTLLAWTSGRSLTIRAVVTGGLLLLCPFTMANGILSGVSLIGTTLLARRPATEQVVAIGLGLGSVALPLVCGYGPRPSGTAAHAPLELLDYTTVYLGGMATSIRIGWAIVGGSVGLVAFAAALWRHRRRPATAQDAVLLGLAGYAIATALVTAWGRLGDGWPVSQALSGRYATTSAFFWSAMIAYMVRRRSPAMRGLSVAVLAVAMVLVVRDSRSYDHALASQYEATRSVERAVCADHRPVSDAELAAIGVDRRTFDDDTAYMRTIGRGICRAPD